MSWNPSIEPVCPDCEDIDSIETIIVPRSRDLGGFEVRRALPSPKRQMVGPFIFFDQAGPADFITGKGIDIRPRPHIGLATVTYLYKGSHPFGGQTVYQSPTKETPTAKHDNGRHPLLRWAGCVNSSVVTG